MTEWNIYDNKVEDIKYFPLKAFKNKFLAPSSKAT